MLCGRDNAGRDRELRGAPPKHVSRIAGLLWLVYVGAAAAVLLNSSLIDGSILMRSRGCSRALGFLVLFWPLASSVVRLNGFRHVLLIPSEWRANWIFQIAESQGRKEWMSAVECFVIAYSRMRLGLAAGPARSRCSSLSWAFTA